MAMNPMMEDEEELFTNVTLPEQVVKPSFLDELQASRGFTAEKEQGLREQVSKAAPGAVPTFLASLGAGIAGNNQASALAGLSRGQEAAKERLNEYLRSKSNVLSEAGAERGLQKADREAKLQLEEEDPASPASVQAREAARLMLPNASLPDTLSAAQLKKVLPSLEKAAEMRARAADRAEARAERRSLMDQNRMDRMDREAEKKALKEEALLTPYGAARTEQDAKELKSASETKDKFDRTMDELIALRKEFGAEVANREAVARGRQLSKDLLLMYKDLAKLGVLSQADEKILNAIIPPDPLAFDSSQLVGQDAILNNLESFKRDKNADFQSKLKTRLKDGQIPATQKPKTVKSKLFSPSRNQTKIIYDDGSEEVVDGKG